MVKISSAEEIRARWGVAQRGALERALAEKIEGEVRFSDGDRALYAADASNYRHPPIGVVIPHSREDVIATVEVCRTFGAPVFSRGAGTSLAGQCCNVAVVIDMSKYLNRVLEIDPVKRVARVEPGTRLDDLRDAAAEHGLTFGPDPATHRWCTIGGMIGNNACGVHSIMSRLRGPGSRTEHQVQDLEVLTYDGAVFQVGPTPDEELDRLTRGEGRQAEIYGAVRDLRDRYADLIRERIPQFPRKVSGYNLECLLPERGFDLARALVGTESTCVTVLEATVHLIPNPSHRAVLLLGYPRVEDAGAHVIELLEQEPLGLEGMDNLLVDFLRKSELHEESVEELLTEDCGWLVVEFGGDTQEEANRRAHAAADALRRGGGPTSVRVYTDPADQDEVWEIRESGLAATAWVPQEDDAWPGWEDAAVPPEHVGEYLREFRRLLDKYGYRAALYGHFGDGCVHTRINFDLGTEDGVEKYRAFIVEAADLVLSFGGSLSGEHGDGQARGELLEQMFGQELVEAFREFKAIWDPDWRMNPGKVVDPYPIAENLRLGPDVHLAEPKTHFQFPNDEGSFARATLRCVGVGKCLKNDRGTMCPSFMVLEEEKHTTRGRAHLLFEMLLANTVEDGWRDEHVKESLDLCLSCKGCKAECPVDVDIATYKAEFLSHYYEGRVRPLKAYLFGNIDIWSKLASVAPDVANLFTQLPLVRDLAKKIAGMPAERSIPPFAPRTFQQWWSARETVESDGARVILWVDTFNNHFHPATAVAAVEVLEAAGYQVVPSPEALCCGRPLYEFGMLDRAKRMLTRILSTLAHEVQAGTPIVGLEPSCVSVFRDELVELFPDRDDAQRLGGQVLTLGEFLSRHPYEPLRMEGEALVHGHCHQKSILHMEPNVDLLQRAGLTVEALDSGCCGMAGGFGFEREKYEVSVAAGERVLLPAVRSAAGDTLIVTDGFSCREQVYQQTGRPAWHLAEVLQLGLNRQEKRDRGNGKAERGADPLDEPTSLAVGATALLGAGVIATGAALAARGIARRVQQRR